MLFFFIYAIIPPMKNSSYKKIISLFLAFLKTGAFTFGGGYAMIALLEREFVEKKKWIDHDEFVDMVAIAESTPGPIAINAATYIGYTTAGFWGALGSTIAVCIPSFVVIYTISLFFDRFLANVYVAAAFKGIQVCVCYLILSAGIKLLKKMKKEPMQIILFSAAVLAMVCITLFSVRFSSIFLIIIGAITGLSVWLISKALSRKGERR